MKGKENYFQKQLTRYTNGILKYDSFHTSWHVFIVIAFLLIVLFWGSVAIGLFIQKNTFIKEFDVSLYTFAQSIPRQRWLDIIITPFNFDFLSWKGRKPSFIYILVGGFLAYMAIFKRKNFLWALLTVVLGSFLILYVAEVDWRFVFRQRPFLTLPSVVDDFSKNAWKHWSSYPSGHTRETSLYSTIISFFIPQIRWIMLGFVIFIGLSRLYLGAHYPTDIIAAALIGYVAAKISLLLIKEVQLLFTKKIKEKNEKRK